MSWTKLPVPLLGKAIYSFKADGPHQLDLKLGDTIIITEATDNWYHGHSLLNSWIDIHGIFPKSYVRILHTSSPSKKRLSAKECTVDDVKDEMLDEILFVLHEWFPTFQELHLMRSPLAETMESVMEEFVSLYREIMILTLTRAQLMERRARVVSKIDFVNHNIKHDLVPRVDGRPVEAVDVTFVELYDIHEQSVLKTRSASPRGSFKASQLTTSPAESYQLRVNVESFDLGNLDDVEIVWNVLNQQDGSYLFEPYHDILNRGIWCGPEEVSDGFVFEEFWPDDLQEDLQLVASIYRRGKMLSDAGKKAGVLYRRPLGSGAIPLIDAFQNPSKRVIRFQSITEHDFPKLVRKAIPHSPPVARTIEVTLTPGIRPTIHISTKSGENAEKTCRRITLHDEGLHITDRDEIYLQITNGEFEKGNKTTGKNIEVKASVMNGKDDAIECIGNGDSTLHYTSAVNYHTNSPDWRELVRINLPEGDMRNLHVLFQFHHCSTREKVNQDRSLFGYAYLKLCDESGIPIQNGPHTLLVIREDNPKKMTADVYLKKECRVFDGHEKSAKDVFQIEINLCSTKRTYKEHVNNFLQWTNIKTSETMLRCLREIQNLHTNEFCKPYLRTRIVSNLLEILSTKSTPVTIKIERDLFITLEMIMAKMKAKRLVTTGMEELISSNPLHLKRMLMCLNAFLLEMVSMTLPVDLAAVGLENVDYLFTRTAYVDDPIKKEECIFLIAECFKLYTLLMKSTEKGHHNLQELILSNFVRSLQACGDLISDTLKTSYLQDILQADIMKKNTLLARSKLEFLKNLLECELIMKDEVIQTLYPLIQNQLLLYTEYKCEHLPLVTKVWAQILILGPHLQQKTRIYIFSLMLYPFLTRIIHNLSFLQKHKKTLNSLLSCTISLLKTIFVDNKGMLQCVAKDNEIKQVLMPLILEALTFIVRHDFRNKDWVVLLMETAMVVLAVIKELAGYIVHEDFDSDRKTWSQFINVCYHFICQDYLQLQTFRQYKKHKIISKFGDLRVDMLDVTLSIWAQKKGFQYTEDLERFFTSVAKKILEVSLLPVTKIRQKTLPLLCSLFRECLKTEEQKSEMEHSLIDNLEKFLQDGKGDIDYLKILDAIQLRLMSLNEDREGMTMGHIGMLVQKHLELREVTNSEESRRKRAMCLNSLMEFYQHTVPNESLYLNYLYQLQELLVESASFLEAGLALRAHTNLLDWTTLSTKEKEEGKKGGSLKEAIFWNMLNYFDKAKAWEYGTEVCQELMEYYRGRYDYEKLSRTLKVASNFYDYIMAECRLPLTYFRVTFIGTKHPSFLKQKDYIYKGSPYFKLGPFCSQLKADFPQYEILSPQVASQRELTDKDHVIILSQVQPLPADEEFVSRESIPRQVRDFYRDHDVFTFTYDRCFHGGKADPNNEMKTLCIERTRVRVVQPMPCLSLWCPVVEVESSVLSPVQAAIDSLKTKNKELESLIAQQESDLEADLRPFTMRLTGVLDAGVNGGVRKYLEAFFSEEYLLQNSNCAADLAELKLLLLTQIDVLGQALALHEELVSEEVRHLHNRLTECFEIMKSTISQTGSPKPQSKHRTSQQHYNVDDIYEKIDEVYGTFDSDIDWPATPPEDDMLMMPARRGRSESIIEDNIGQLVELLSAAPPSEPRRRGVSIVRAQEYRLSQQKIFEELSQVFNEHSDTNSPSGNKTPPKVKVLSASSSEDLLSTDSRSRGSMESLISDGWSPKSSTQASPQMRTRGSYEPVFSHVIPSDEKETQEKPAPSNDDEDTYKPTVPSRQRSVLSPIFSPRSSLKDMKPAVPDSPRPQLSPKSDPRQIRRVLSFEIPPIPPRRRNLPSTLSTNLSQSLPQRNLPPTPTSAKMLDKRQLSVPSSMRRSLDSVNLIKEAKRKEIEKDDDIRPETPPRHHLSSRSSHDMTSLAPPPSAPKARLLGSAPDITAYRPRPRPIRPLSGYDDSQNQQE